jgi:uncharacterized protein YbjT (DUF2867 family)
MTSILITGGTGALGRELAPLLTSTGNTVRILSRRQRTTSQSGAAGIEYVAGDVSSGQGLDQALDGITTVLHCAGSDKGDEVKARHLVRAVSRSKVDHLVFISVVGTDRIPVVSGVDRAVFGYFAAKREAELIIEDSGIPYTTLRATQFHDFVLNIMQLMARLPVLPLWAGARFQPVDKHEVAARLAELALTEPSGLVPDIAGPRIYQMDELARGYLRATGKRRLIMNVRTPGKAAAAFRAGGNLSPEHAVGGHTWEQFLASRFATTVSG